MSVITVAPALPRGLAFLREFHQSSGWAAFTAFTWYAFGLVPLQLAVNAQLGLTPAQSASSICIVWITSALSTFGLAIAFRQPIAITTNSVGLIYLGTLAGRFSYEELIGAFLVAGLAFLALSLSDVTRRMLTWFPLSIVMGVVAGSFLDYGVRLVTATIQDLAVVGGAVVAYLAGRAWNHPRVPPMGLATVCGLATLLLAQQTNPVPLDWALPTLEVGLPLLSPAALVAAALPLVLLMVGRDFVPALSFLIGQGYSVPARAVMGVVGAGSVVNAFFGGPPATVSRDGGAILAGPDAGPQPARYWSSLVVAGLMLALALGAASAVGILAILPRSFVVALAGLAILGALHQCLETTFSGKLRFGSLVAFVVAATPFTLLGMTSACWALLAGLLASALIEGPELRAHLREQADVPTP